MYDVADVCCEKNHCQRTDDGRTISCDNRTQQAEYTDRGQFQDHLHTFHKDVIEVIKSIYNTDIFFADKNDGKSKDQSHNNNLKHIGFCHW